MILVVMYFYMLLHYVNITAGTLMVGHSLTERREELFFSYPLMLQLFGRAWCWLPPHPQPLEGR